MSSTSLGKCPLCSKVLLAKNFKRHCEKCHNSVNTKEKYEKLLLKMKQTNNSQHQHTPTSNNSTSSNESSTIISNKTTTTTISDETNIEPPAVDGYESSPDVILRPDDAIQTSASSESTSSNEPSTTVSNKINTEPSTADEYVLSSDITLKPDDDTQTSASKSTSSNKSSTIISNKTSTTVSNETNTELPAVDEYLLSSDVILKPDDDKSFDSVQFQHFVELKNQICGDIRCILKQTEFGSKLVELAIDETVSVKNFLLETTSRFNKIKESIDDLLILCNKTLENIPSIPTTVYKIQSTEELISRDPSIMKVFDENELYYLTDQGPYQPLLSQYPVNKQLKMKNNTCHFVPQWYKEFPLIEYSPITDSIYCFCCRLFGHGSGGAQSENTWISAGMKMWNKVKGSQGTGKKGKIYVHLASETHKSSLNRYMIFKERKNNVDYMLNKELQQQEQQKIEQRKTNEQIIKILIDCSRFLASQGLAFRGHTDEDGNFYQLVNLLSQYNPILHDWINNNNTRPYKVSYMSKDSQNEFIQLLGECVQEKNLFEIRQATYYSIMADSSIDSNRKDMLSVYIRFVNEQGEPEERFVSIKEAHSKTGDGIANHLLEVLNELGLDTTKLIAQSYDCANNMCGQMNGVQAKVSEKLHRDIKYIPCSAHRSNTVVKHSSEASLDIYAFFGTLQTVYVFFTSSTKRMNVLDEKYSTNLFSLIPKTTATTRWNAKYQSMRAMYESFDEIIQALNTTANNQVNFDQESRQQAKSISSNIITLNFTIYLVFMKNLMAMINSLSIHFQSEKLDLLAAGELLSGTIQLLERERSDEVNLNNIIAVGDQLAKRYGINPDEEFHRKHRKRRPPRRLDDNPQTTFNFSRTQYYRTIFRQVMDQLIVEYKEISKSIDSNVKSLSKLSPKYINNFTKIDAENIIEMIGIDDGNLLYNEVQLFKDKLSEFETITLASKFVHQRKTSLPSLRKAYQYLLTLPISVASVERSFSKMKIVKNRLRTTMTDERLYSLLLCTLESSILDQLDSTEVLEKWLKNKTGRRI